MRAEVVSMTADNLDMEAIRRGGDILKQGGLVAFPTETVYGLGGDALNPQASMKIYAAKGRPSDNPLIVHIAEFDKLARSRILYHRKLRVVWTVWRFVFRVTGSRRNLSRQQVVMWLRPVPTLREDQARLLHSM